MYIHNFLPYWYIRKKNKELNTRLSKYIIILIILNISFIIVIGIKFTQIKRIENNLLSISNKNNNVTKKEFVKNNKALKNLEEFMLIYDKNLKISNVSIEKNQVEFTCNINEYNKIIELIENIELKNTFSIKNINPLKDLKENKNENSFKMILEVNGV